jgi:hypothetical protein
MGKRKQRAVRLLELTVRKTIRTGRAGVSGSHAGGSAEALERYVWKLKKLARDDRDNVFWPTLQKAILRILRLLDKGKK